MRRFILFLLLLSAYVLAIEPAPTPPVLSNSDAPDSGGILQMLSDLLNGINRLPNEVSKAVGDEIRGAIKGFFLKPIAGFISAAFVFINSNPNIASDSTKAAFNDFVLIIEMFFIAILLWNAIRLIFSSFLGAVNREEAKEGVKKTFLAMFLVWLSYEIYFIALGIVSAVVKLLSPTSEEWTNALSSALSSDILSFFVLVVAVITLLLFLIIAILRWILVYLGLFMLPFAFALEALSFTRTFGSVMKSIIIANFIVQIVDVLLFKLLILLLINYDAIGLGISAALGKSLLAVGVFVLIIIVTLGLYLTAMLEAVLKDPVAGKVIKIGKGLVPAAERHEFTS